MSYDRGTRFNTIYHSQFGEDRIIEALARWLGVMNGWCFEVGAGDGCDLSNTFAFRAHNWESVLVEKTQVPEQWFLNDHCLQAEVNTEGEDSIDSILMRYHVPVELDLVSLDIDSFELYLWQSIRKFRPRFVCVEYGWRIKDNSPTLAECRPGNQSGSDQVDSFAESINYRPAARTECNSIYFNRQLNTMGRSSKDFRQVCEDVAAICLL